MMHDPLKRVRLLGAGTLLPALLALCLAVVWLLRPPRDSLMHVDAVAPAVDSVGGRAAETSFDRAAFNRAIWSDGVYVGDATRAPEAAPVENPQLHYRFLGLAVYPEAALRAIFHNRASGEIIKAEAGERLDDWRLESVTTEAVMLRHVDLQIRLLIDARDGDSRALSDDAEEEGLPHA